METIAALLSGAAMAIQGAFDATLAKPLGLFWMLVSVHLIATATAVALALWRTPHLPALASPAPWLYLAGPLGVAITAFVAYSVPRLGMVRTTTFILVAQLLMAALIDYLGLFGTAVRPFALWRLFGVGLLAAGAQILLHN